MSDSDSAVSYNGNRVMSYGEESDFFGAYFHGASGKGKLA
jgi:hypothetical protein